MSNCKMENIKKIGNNLPLPDQIFSLKKSCKVAVAKKATATREVQPFYKWRVVYTHPPLNFEMGGLHPPI